MIRRFAAYAAVAIFPLQGTCTEATIDRSIRFRDGVTLKRLVFETPKPMAVYIANIDLTTPGIGFTATERAAKWGEPMPDAPKFTIETERETTAAFMSRRRAEGKNVEIAVNTAPWRPWRKPWNHRYGQLRGWNVSDGMELTRGMLPEGALLIVRKDGRADIVSSVPFSETNQIAFAMCGFSIVMQAGTNCCKQIRGVEAPPRTALGLTADRRTLVIAVVDGRQPGYSLGATEAEICDIMRGEGCTDVVNMDGGGSSSLVVFDCKRGKPKMLNGHKGGGVRKVAVNFGITFQESESKTKMAATCDKTLNKLAACAAAVTTGAEIDAVANVPEPRNVPELMKTFSGEQVKTIAEWESIRAPEILERYRREVFGVRPKEADERGRVSFKMRDIREVMDGKAIRKVLDVVFDGKTGGFSFPVTVFIPKSPEKVPAFVLACNVKRSTVDADGALSSPYWPVGDIVGRGFATAAFVIGDVAPDDKMPDFDRTVFRAVQNAADRDSESWAAVSAWAWAASRVMDWIETEPLIDSAHVGVVGHSRCGKTAIWTAVNDRRFAMACSNNSGCTGAKLNHISLPRSESISKVTGNFPHWFCRNYGKYANRDKEMDFDQHELLALIAPRLLCVASATEDHWAGQRGEWWAAKLASPAWELYGKKGLVADSYPAPETQQQEGCISYHLRTGKHFLSPYDWKCFMDFAERHGWRSAKQ